MNDEVQGWYANFINVEQEILFKIIQAAYFMDIKPLIELSCATVVSMVKGKNT